MKKITALLCGAAVLFGQLVWSSTPVFADSLTLDQKANILNQIHLLRGDGISYNLTGKLKRSEAAAFIVNVLGMQNKVLQQKDSYSQTRFKDVPKTEWYAPYVGYMTQQNLIAGYPDGTFKPNEFISEKAFFSMVLKAMGYTASDFDWDTVNKVAFEAGLVEDIMYVFKEDDNNNYLRGDVVNTLYNALGKPMKGQNKKFIQLLVDSGMITTDKAELFGFVKIDKLATAVKTIKVVNTNQVAVTFNEDVVVPTADQISVYLKADPTKKLQVKSLLWDVNVLTIDMEAQTDKQAYIVEFASITDIQGNKVTGVKSDFTGFNSPELVSPYFKISKVEAANQKTVNVYFTHPLNEKADMELLYDLYLGDNKWIEGSYKSIALKRNENQRNMLTISLREGVFTADTAYTLKIKGDLKSAYGINLNKGDGESITFKGTAGTLVPTSLKSAYCQEGVYVFIEFSQVVDKDSALKTGSYTLKERDTGKIVSINQVYAMKALESLDKGFVLRTSGLTHNKVYELSVRGVYDTYKTAELPAMKWEMLGSNTSGESLSLVSVIPFDRFTAIAIFNRELKESSANVAVSVEEGPVVAMKQIDPENPKHMRLYFSSGTPLQNNKNYAVRFFTGVTDFMDKSVTTTMTASLVGTDRAKDAVAIESAYFVDESTIMVKYNQPVHKTQAAIVGKYDVYYSDGKSERMLLPSSAELVSDRVVMLKLPYMMAKGAYRLQVREILDLTGQFSTPIMNIEVK